MAKPQQKSSGSFGDKGGTATVCRIMGYLSKVKKNERPVLASLTHLREIQSPFRALSGPVEWLLIR
jgi:hypothetical protein